MTLPHGQGVRYRLPGGGFRHPKSQELAVFNAKKWSRGLYLTGDPNNPLVRADGKPVQPTQAAPGSPPPPLTSGTSRSNRAAEVNRMRQQGGGGSTQSRPATAQPSSPSAHVSGWTPETRGAAYAAGKAMEDDRLGNQAAGLPALWGDVRPDSDPRSESYWQRADMQQWANANFDLANRSRRRYGLPDLVRGVDGKITTGGGSVSPYANVFAQPAKEGLPGFGQQEAVIGAPRVNGPDFPANGPGFDIAAAYSWRYGDLNPATNYQRPLSTQAQQFNPGADLGVNTGAPAANQMAAVFANARSQAPAGFTGPSVMETPTPQPAAARPTGLMRPIPQEERELMNAGYQGGGLGDEFLKRFRLQAK